MWIETAVKRSIAIPFFAKATRIRRKETVTENNRRAIGKEGN